MGEAGPDLRLERAAALDHLALRAQPWARHDRESTARIPSISASVASSSSTPDAAAFSCTCSGRDAPTIADATSSSRSTHASASCARRDARGAPRPGARSCTRSSTSSSSQPAHQPPHPGARRPRARRRRLARPVLPGQRALRERRPDDLRDPVLRGRAGSPRAPARARAASTAAASETNRSKPCARWSSSEACDLRAPSIR